MSSIRKETDYERDLRLKIEENKRLLQELFPMGANLDRNINGISSPVSRGREKRESTKRRATIHVPLRRNPNRQKRSYQSYDSEEEDAEEVVYTENTLIVKWPGPLTAKLFNRQLSEASSSGSDTDSDSPSRKKRKGFTRKAAPRAPVDVREEDLVLVAERVADKNYDAVNGTSCHQCRQKTDDLKTTCKSNSCVGIRGQFCGPCLRNRYGEDAKEAIMNPNWSCPPCRGICNCSFCMKKRGRRATGIMIHLAKANGYEDVKTYLGD